jgi:outer membrane immunogenic protein
MKGSYFTFAAVGLGICLAQNASAANLPLPAMAPPAPPPYDMTGFYVGGHGGAAWASEENITGGIYGIQGGYNYQIPTRWDALGWYVNAYVLGVEADGTWANVTGDRSASSLLPDGTQILGHGRVKDLWDVVGRFGLVEDSGLLYVRGGYARSRQDFSASLLAPDRSLVATSIGTSNSSGWVLGTGVQVTPDLQFTSLGTMVYGVQYDYFHFDPNSNCAFGVCGHTATNVQTLRFRLDLLFNNHHPTCISAICSPARP